MGIDHIIRYVGYGTATVQHVYPVAILQGRKIPLDVVFKKQQGGRFGTEKPFTIKKDFFVEGLYKLGSVGTAQADLFAVLGKMEDSLQQLQDDFADIPDDIIQSGPGDVTLMTSGELDR